MHRPLTAYHHHPRAVVLPVEQSRRSIERMNPVVWKVAAFVLLLLVVGTFSLLRVESVSVWLRAPTPQQTSHTTNNDDGAGGVVTAVSQAQQHGITSCTGGSSSSDTFHKKDDRGSGVRITRASNRTILPGELPGYTGWSRPATTLVHHFDIVKMSSTAPITGQNWTVTAHCRHPKARSGRAQFYVRAYGPSILPGRVTDHGNGTYDFTILPFDAGVYHLEVVLVFSFPPAWKSLPTNFEPGYEGYLLPGFPIELDVSVGAAAPSDPNLQLFVGVSTPSSRRRLCNMSELTETSTDSDVETRRLLVVPQHVALPK